MEMKNEKWKMEKAELKSKPLWGSVPIPEGLTGSASNQK